MIAANHVTYIDWLIIFGSIKRPVRFVMHHSFSHNRLVWPLMKQAHVIPIASAKENPDNLRVSPWIRSRGPPAGELVSSFLKAS